MRFYGFRAEEIADEQTPRLDLDIDPKLAWALRNPAFFLSMSTVRTTRLCCACRASGSSRPG